MSKTEKKSRRNFLKTGLIAGAGVAVGGGLLSISSFSPDKTGDKTKVLTTDGYTAEVETRHVHKPKVSLKEIRNGIPGKKFVMVIDLAKCKNARECVIKCQKMHHLPPDQEWIKIHLLRDSKNTSPYWFPKPCFHCDNPPCVSLCPVSATYKRTDGCVLVDNSRCIGCKFCMTGCPYSARVFNWEKVELTPEEEKTEYSPEIGIPRVHGTIGKCDFCPDSARQGKLPDCVTACPNGVIYYGDITEDVVSNGAEVVRFSELITNKSGYQYAKELGTNPSVYYLPPVDRLFSAESGLQDLPEEIKNRYKDVIDY